MTAHGHIHPAVHRYRVVTLARVAEDKAGPFELVTREVEVPTRDEAGDAALAVLHGQGFETLHVHAIEGRLD